MPELIALVALGAIASAWAIPIILKSFIERSVGKRFDRAIEELRYDIRVREQAAKTAEYLSLAWRLDKSDSPEVFQRVNQLGWELALFLPATTYRHVVHGITQMDREKNVLTALIEVRQLLLKDAAGDLAADEIALHAPGARAAMQGEPQTR